MLYVVCYDISRDPVRDKVSRLLQGYGTRIQESVFECIMDEELVTRMLGELPRTGLADSDRVRVYKMCGRCVQAVAIYGPGEVTTEPDFYLV